MVDPYPFGGGVTSLEALAVCTPVVTLPSRQTVPALTAGMIRKVFAVQSNLTAPSQTSQSNPTALSQSSQSNLTESVLIATNEKEYVRLVVNLLATTSSLTSSSSSSSSLLIDLRRSFCQSNPTTRSGTITTMILSLVTHPRIPHVIKHPSLVFSFIIVSSPSPSPLPSLSRHLLTLPSSPLYLPPPPLSPPPHHDSISRHIVQLYRQCKRMGNLLASCGCDCQWTTLSQGLTHANTKNT